MSDASLIRTILARECDTVNEYEALAAQAEDPAVRKLILHFAEEEKEHIAECALALAHIDAPFKRFLDKPLSHVDDAWSTPQAEPTAQAEAPAPVAPSAPPAEPAEPVTLASGVRLLQDPYAATVGSLFRAPKP